MIVLTPGDPAGIGPEVMIAAWSRRGVGADVRLVGDPRIWLSAAAGLHLDGHAVRAACVGTAGTAPLPRPGHPDEHGARLAWAALDEAVALCHSGDAAAVVTGPIAKGPLLRIGFPYPGHTEYLAARAGVSRVLMVMSAKCFHVGLHTVHVPLRQVADMVTAAGVAADLVLLDAYLRQLGLSRRRIAVCGLNPHAGEGGALGHEEAAIAAGIAAAQVHAEGPLPGDTVFAALAAGTYDAVLAMYHDQGLAPFKLRHFHDGVNVTVGLPYVRTSPDHGTAFALKAVGDVAAIDSGSAVAALALAERLCAQAGGSR